MRLLGLVGAAAGAVVAARALGGWSLAVVDGGLARVEDGVTLAACTAGALVALWYCLTALALLVAELAASSRQLLGVATGLRRLVRRLGAPALRRAAVIGVGTGLALGTAPALAADAEAGLDSAQVHDQGTVPADLRPGASWSEADDDHSLPGAGASRDSSPSATFTLVARPEPGVTGSSGSQATAPVPTSTPVTTPSSTPAPSPTPASAPAPSPTQAPPPPPSTPTPPSTPAPSANPGAAQASSVAATPSATYVVRPGDTLWEIAAAHLGADAAKGAVAAEWPRWHALNRAVIGTDPDLIHPGQTLLAPDSKDAR